MAPCSVTPLQRGAAAFASLPAAAVAPRALHTARSVQRSSRRGAACAAARRVSVVAAEPAPSALAALPGWAAPAAGSLDRLVTRGHLSEDRHREGDPFYDATMKRVNTVQYGELSSDQIAAARARRSRERSPSPALRLEDIELPDNHPFASRTNVSAAEEELMLARLRVRRGVPLQSLGDLAATDARAARRARQGSSDDE